MFFRQLLHEGKSCASYVVGCPSRGVAVVVDPQGDPRTYLELLEAKGMKLNLVVETHIHADHLSAGRALASAAEVPHSFGQSAGLNFEFTPLADGEVIEVGNRRLKVLSTPGHTPEHICLLVDEWFVLTGDTLFVGDVGRVDLSHSDEGLAITPRADALYESLQRLLELPAETEVFPGHYAGSVCGRGMDGKPVSTIGRESRSNAPLQMSKSEFIDFQKNDLPPLPEDFGGIKEANISGRPLSGYGNGGAGSFARTTSMRTDVTAETPMAVAAPFERSRSRPAT